jgi:anion-transporting  ArsA/GET3 family ATPase
VSPPTWVCLGTGGVGKTTVAAALAAMLAARGQRTLVATVDPARRLGDTVGLPGLRGLGEVPGQPRLTALVPDPVAGVRSLIARWLIEFPDHANRLADNPLVEALTGGLAGIHELISLAELAHHRSTEALPIPLVIDTAPSRHALELLALPSRLGAIIDGRALRWFGQLARQAVVPTRGLTSRLARWGQDRLLQTFSASIGDAPIAAALALLALAADVQPELSQIVANARAMLAPAQVQIAIVTAARPGAIDELEEMRTALAELGHAPALVVINRVPGPSPRVLVTHPSTSPELRACARLASEANESARTAAAAIHAHVRTWRVPVIEVPAVSPSDPIEVVAAVAAVLAAGFTDDRGPSGSTSPGSRSAPAILQYDRRDDL